MSDDFRIRIVREALDRHVASPSLDHIRDAAMLDRLAAEIVLSFSAAIRSGANGI